MEDFEVEFENNQETGSENPAVETPAEPGEKQEPSEAAKPETPVEEASETEEKAEAAEPESPKLDDDLDEWAVKAGHDKPETEGERKLLQKLRQSSRDFTKEQQAKKGASKLTQAIAAEEKDAGIVKPEPKDDIEKRLSPIEQELKAERASRLQSEFFTSNNVTESTATVMADILKEEVAAAETPEEKQKVIDYLTDPKRLSQWHKMAVARELTSTDAESAVSEATQKERERIAKEAKASGVVRNAKTTVAQAQESELEKLWKD